LPEDKDSLKSLLNMEPEPIPEPDITAEAPLPEAEPNVKFEKGAWRKDTTLVLRGIEDGSKWLVSNEKGERLAVGQAAGDASIMLGLMLGKEKITLRVRKQNTPLYEETRQLSAIPAGTVYWDVDQQDGSTVITQALAPPTPANVPTMAGPGKVISDTKKVNLNMGDMVKSWWKDK